MTTPLVIDPALDPRRIAAVFARSGRIHLPGVFSREAAAGIGAAISGDGVPWVKSWRTSGPSLDGSLQDFEAMTPDLRTAFDADMAAAARAGFCFRFDAWRLSDDILAGKRRGGALAPLEAVHDFLNGEAFLTFVRTLTGEPRCAYCDVMVSRYRAGDFLSAHDDDIVGKKRLFAYVLNFTPAWRADWGGVLNFLDEDGHVAEGYTPTFNALNLFRVPQEHAVSIVAPFAAGPRLSITGWVRAR